MTIWVVGYCKDDDCRWATGHIREDRFSQTRVVTEMIDHTEVTGHHARTTKHRR